MWNPFRSKLAAAILGGVDKIHIKPGSKVLYLGAASGTTVSHVADIVGPVSQLVCGNVCYVTPSLASPLLLVRVLNLLLQFISVSNSPHYHSSHSPYHHFIPSPLTPSPSLHQHFIPHHSPHHHFIPSPFSLSALHPITTHQSPFTPSPLHLITTSPFHLITPPPPHTHSLTGGSGVCCGVLSPLREGPDQCSQEENQHHPHHRGCQTPAQV